MNEAFSLIGDVGFPIAIALIAGFFIFLTIKYILESVIGQVDGIHGIVKALDNRVQNDEPRHYPTRCNDVCGAWNQARSK